MDAKLDIFLGDDDLGALLASVDASIPGSPPSIAAEVKSAGAAAADEPLLDDSWWVFDEQFVVDFGNGGDENAAVCGVSMGLSSTKKEDKSPHEEAVVSTPYARVIASRQRSKAEREHLKQRVSELEAQLSMLKDMASTTSAGDLPPELLAAPTIASSVEQFWQRLAQSERQARHDAVAENLRLREQLEGQLRVARSLMKLLRKRPSDQETSDGLLMPKRLRVNHGDEDAAVFAALELNVQGKYDQVDRVFEESGLAGNRTTYQDARLHLGCDDAEGVGSTKASSWFLEFVNSTVVPFNWEMTHDVAWRAMLSPKIPLTNGEYEVVEAGDDYVRALFTVHMKVRGTDVVSRAQFVARRFVEAERFILVWSLSSVIQGGLLKNQRVLFQEEGWSSISPLTEGGEELCLTQACGRMQPKMTIRPGSKLEEHVGVLTDIVLDCYHETQRGLYDFTGRLLLDEAARRQ